MPLSGILAKKRPLVLNCPIKTRLEFEQGIKIPAWQLPLIGQGDALRVIFQSDIELSERAGLPIIINSATFRASRNHLDISKWDFQSVNQANLKLIEEIKAGREHVVFAAAMGSMFDAYSVEKIPSVDEACDYHSEQIKIFDKFASIDYINVITLPSVNEALGIAQAINQLAEKEYTIGFILSSDGKLLDGNSLDDAIKKIDSQVKRRPVGYMIYCTHASVLEKIEPNPRLIGLKANASSAPLAMLDQSDKAVADSPEEFSEQFGRQMERLQLKIVGGCCGTSTEHLNRLLVDKGFLESSYPAPK